MNNDAMNNDAMNNATRFSRKYEVSRKVRLINEKKLCLWPALLLPLLPLHVALQSYEHGNYAAFTFAEEERAFYKDLPALIFSPNADEGASQIQQLRQLAPISANEVETALEALRNSRLNELCQILADYARDERKTQLEERVAALRIDMAQMAAAIERLAVSLRLVDASAPTS